MIRCIAITIIMLTHAAFAGDDNTRKLHPVGDPFEVGKGLQGKIKDGEVKKAKDISGIACLPPVDGRRRCLVINDENSGAQFVTIENRKITPGDVLPLIGKAASPATRGAPPKRHDCSGGSDAFTNLDGEGVAYAAPYFYVVGSHGCGRHGDLFQLSSFILARIRVQPDGSLANEQAVETTYRLSDALKKADVVGAHFAQDLQREKVSNGLNVEGVAVVGKRLFVGLRAPSIGGRAYLVAVDVEPLFAEGHGSLAAEVDVIPLAIEPHAGIRDLAVRSDKELLVLTGPAQEQEVDYAIYVIEPKPGGRVEARGRLAKLDGDDEGAKAEALTALGGDRVLMLFDGIKNGGPREYDLSP